MQKKFIVVLFLFVLIVLAGCQPGVPELVEQGSQEPTGGICQQRGAVTAAERDQFWVKGQIMLTGDEQAITSTLASLADRATFTLLERCQLNSLPPDEDGGFYRLFSNLTGRTLAGEQTADVISDLYQVSDRPGITGTLTITDLIRMIDARAADQFLIANPNYLVGPSTHTVGTGPFGEPGAVVTPTHILGYMTQWAFANVTSGEPLNLFSRRSADQPVRVGIFDTSPFSNIVPAGTVNALVRVGWAQPVPLLLKVSHPALAVTSPPTATRGVAEHGLFVAGLVHAMAPASDIALIRVVPDNNVGTLSDLRRALFNYIQLNQDAKGRLDNVVINLSLGVHAPKDRLERKEELADLLWPLAYAYEQGALIVAAAGNESGNDGVVAPEQHPAIYPFVLGVAASTDDNVPACYSNEVAPDDVAAPGGNGGPSDGHACAPMAVTCTDPSCVHGLMSLVTHKISPTGYAYWAGTSFATPLVSAIGVLIWERHPGLSPEEVADRIRSKTLHAGDTRLGAGISNAACAVLSPAEQPAICPP